jgi:uncharacterized protein YjbI with pentapeptide repeats
MSSELIIDEIFENLDFTKKNLPGKDFDNCSFKNCNFSGGNLTGNNFIDCRFEQCNFSNTNLTGTALKDAVFTGCKLMGVDFSKCSDLLLSFEFVHCQLDFSFFTKRKIKKTNFRDCSIKEANFTEADLTGSVFQNCDLWRTLFDRSNLSQVDFRTAVNFTIDPENNKLKKARFGLEGIPGLLTKYDIDIT